MMIVSIVGRMWKMVLLMVMVVGVVMMMVVLMKVVIMVMMAMISEHLLACGCHSQKSIGCPAPTEGAFAS